MADSTMTDTHTVVETQQQNNPLLLIALAVLAGLVSWGIGEQTRELAQIPLEISAKSYQFKELNAATIRVNSINGALVYGVLGALTCLGLAVGLKPRPTARLLALVAIGAIAGALPCFVVMPLHWMNRNQDPSVLDLTRPLLYHIGLWLPIGLAGGLAYSMGRGLPRPQWLGLMISGMLGALVGTLVYEFTGAIAMPMDLTVDPMAATAKARLLAHLAVPVGIAASLAYASKGKRDKRANA